MAEDWRKKIDQADEEASKTADDEVQPELDEITKEATKLQDIFNDLKFTDQETYDRLIAIVKNATSRNESMASVLQNLRALGAAGKNLATKIAGAASGGGVAALSSALGIK